VVTCYNFYNMQYAKPERMPEHLDLLQLFDMHY